ncbi:helix-turn-helix transcriptional regulator [Kozakia baliensis]|uniref:helix-turn-helix domain-containing protein n=1 Tax=Kozakia baliensis TaxID=153496 RepID=UPI00345C13EF
MAANNKNPSAAGEKDIHIGYCIRRFRNQKKISQEKLADELDVTFQQVQKYERGTNRVTAARLAEIADILETPVAYFYDGMPGRKALEKAPTRNFPAYNPRGFAEEVSAFEGPPPKYQAPPMEDVSLLSSKEAVELVRNYYGIPDKKVRKQMLALIRSMNAPNDE